MTAQLELKVTKRINAVGLGLTADRLEDVDDTRPQIPYLIFHSC